MEEYEMKFNMKLADLMIEVYPRYPTLKEFCKDYICKTEEEAQIIVKITEDDINKERQNNEEAEESPQYLETLAALRQIADQIPKYHRFLCHGAAITWKDQSFLFTAPSGTGKSTHIALWKKYLGDDVDIINGDKPFMKIDKSEIRIYGSPWAGKEFWQKNRSAKLDGICILKQSKRNQIRKLMPKETVAMMIRQVYFTQRVSDAEKTLDLLDQLLRNVQVYMLECDISREAVKCSFEAMTGESMSEENGEAVK